jgi:hypothetical protein
MCRAYQKVVMEQSHAYRPPVVIDALDDVSVELKLGHHGGGEVDPAGVQLVKGDRLVPALAQSLKQPLLLDVKENHRPIVAAGLRSERRQASLLPLNVGDWRLVAPHLLRPAAVD